MALHVVVRRNLGCLLSKNLFSPKTSISRLPFFISGLSTASEAKPFTSPSVYEFLTQKHHFSPEVASRAASILTHFNHPEKYDSVLSFFNQIGFTKAQLEKTLILRPHLLGTDLERIIKPKVKIFQDLGFSSDDISAIISNEPMILHASVENKLVPVLSWLKGALRSNDKVARVLRKAGRLLLADLENHTLPNVCTFMSHGMTMDQVARVLNFYPRVLLYKRETLTRCLDSVDKMGVNWSSTMSVYAVGIICSMPNGAWERKLMAFREILEFTEKDILRALRQNPVVFAVSEEKMRMVKQFVLGTGKYDTLSFAKYPRLIMHSIERRYKPRFEVLGMLEGKGLIKKWPSLGSICQLPDKQFFEEYVGRYMSEIGEDNLEKRELVKDDGTPDEK